MNSKIKKLRFPYLTILGLFFIIVFALLENPLMLNYLPKQYHQYLDQNLQLVFLTLGLLIFIWSFIRFQRISSYQNKNIKDLIEKSNKIQAQNKSLNKKAFTYSSHADKLKYFISEKLLEFIEYDEKYLHFKSIASEVRHNGVISYDKVKTFITTLQTQLKILDNQNSTIDIKSIETSSLEALNSMKYLWDLLDLATTDNIALHISNHLCDCEEKYIQQSLNATDAEFNDFSFQPKFALLDFLSTLNEPNEEFEKLKTSKKKVIEYNNEHFHIIINKSEELLGNPNHFILLIENIIKNAQFFLQKAKFKQRSDKILIELNQDNQNLLLNIYNRGPNIKDENVRDIFKLGFSTRKVKENHGKGLGLFFSHEIISGYEGSIEAVNINNPNHTYKIDLTFQDQTSSSFVLEQISENEVLQVNTLKNHDHTICKNRVAKSEFNQPLRRARVTNNYTKQYKEFSFEDNNAFSHVDGFSNFPAFNIDLTNKKKSSSIKWTALDISGVQFQMLLPLASARLDEFDDSDMDFEDEFESLDQQFNQDLD